MEEQQRDIHNAVVVVIEREDGKLLFVERSHHDSYPGYWNPVTGTCDVDDQDCLYETCVREAKEEVGLDVEVLGKVWTSTTAGAHFVLHWFLARVIGAADVTPDPEEVAGYRWLDVEGFCQLRPSFADTRSFFESVWPTVYDNALMRTKHG